MALFTLSQASEQLQAPPLGQLINSDPNDWPMYNHDARGSRSNASERHLTADNVDKLKGKWFFSTAGDVYATPAVVDNVGRMLVIRSPERIRRVGTEAARPWLGQAGVG